MQPTPPLSLMVAPSSSTPLPPQQTVPVLNSTILSRDLPLGMGVVKPSSKLKVVSRAKMTTLPSNKQSTVLDNISWSQVVQGRGHIRSNSGKYQVPGDSSSASVARYRQKSHIPSHRTYPMHLITHQPSSRLLIYIRPKADCLQGIPSTEQQSAIVWRKSTINVGRTSCSQLRWPDEKSKHIDTSAISAR